MLSLNQRQSDLLRYIDEHGEATLAELSKVAAGCSNMTLWRDLKRLEESERIVRTRGGAKAIGHPADEREQGAAGPYSARASRNTALKQRIGRAASKYVEPGKSLFFDSGSTMMALVEALPNQRYSIVTYGANIAIALSQLCDGNVYAIGGELNSGTLSCTGRIAEAALGEINIDTAFMTASGLCERCGFTTSNMAEYAMKKIAIAKAARVIMLLDSSKFGKIFPFSFAQAQHVDLLVTDAPPPDALFAQLRRCGTEVVLAPAPEEGLNR